MKETNGAKQKLLLGLAAGLLIMCLMTGSVLAGYLTGFTEAEKNCINLNESESHNTSLTALKNLTVGAAKRPALEAIGDEEDTVWETETKVDIFRLSYDKNTEQVTVKSADTDKIIAPGTENSYSFSLKNSKARYADYSVWVEAKVEPEDLDLPLNVRMSKGDGAWLLGSSSEWKKPLDLNSVKDEGRLRVNESNSYTLTWQWPFEQGNDEFDTLLGNRTMNEDLNFTIIIHTLSTNYESSGSSSDSGESGGSHGGSSSSGTNESGNNNGFGNNGNGNDSNSNGNNGSSGTDNSGNGSGSSGNGTNNEINGRPNGGSNNGNRCDNGSFNNDGNGTENANNSDKNQIDGTKPGTDKTDENIGTETGKETGTNAAEAGRKLPWWLFLLLLPFLFLLFWRRRIYVTGFVESMSGNDLNWGQKRDRIRPDGRFVFEKMPFGKHTFKVTAPDGHEKAVINWRLKRDNDVNGVKIEKQDGEYTVLAGKHVRAVELYFDVDQGELKIKPARWAAIDSDKNVYTPTGMRPPANDGTNITPGGLWVDGNKKLDFYKQEG